MNQDIKLYLTEYGFLDLENDRNKSFGIPLVFQVSDVSDITKRKSNFSKSIKIPGTPNNNIIFNQAYEITKSGGFNAITKHPCVLLVDSNPIIQGYLLLNEITKLKVGEGYQIEYSVNIYDEVNNFFSDLKQKKLKELSFASGFTFTSYKDNQAITKVYDKGDHIFNELNVLTSYGNNVYKYPIVNYNYNNLFYWDFTGNRWKYPYSGVNLGCLYPAVHIKAIFDKIFYDNGYSYESNFLNDYTGSTLTTNSAAISGLFHKLLNIYNGNEKLTTKVYSKNTIQTAWTKPQPTVPSTHYCEYYYYVPFGNGRNYILMVPQEDYPYNNVYRTVAPTYHTYSNEIYDSLKWATADRNNKEPLIQIPADGEYTVQFYIDVDIDHGGTLSGTTTSWTNLSGLTSYDLRVENDVKRRSQIGGQTYGNSHPFGPIGDYDDAPLNIHLTNQDMGFTGYNKQLSGDTGYVFSSSAYTFTGRVGDVLYLQVNQGQTMKNNLPTAVGLQYKINNFKIKLTETVPDDDFIDKYGTELSLASFLPDMSQADFVKNIINMFNLYVRYDKEDNKLLHIEPFDYFYSQGSVIDWSSLVDYSDKINISTLTDKLKNSYVYKYSDTEDYYSMQFLNSNGYYFGTKVINLNNQYLKDEQIHENKYQSFQNYNTRPEDATRLTATGYYSGNTYVSIPILTNDLNSTIINEKVQTKPIMGIYNFNSFTYGPTSAGGNEGYYMTLLTNNGWDAYNIYYFQEVSMLSPKTKNYVVKLDDTTYTYNSSDAYSLQYSQDYGTNLFTGNTYNYSSIEYLYSKYHQNQLENIINNESREVEFMINLSINDIVKLDFRNKIYIDGQNYLLQKINFDPTETESSKVLLLKEI